MKSFHTLLITFGALAAFVIGCSSTKSTENMLSAAGFKMVPADTPERVSCCFIIASIFFHFIQAEGALESDAEFHLRSAYGSIKDECSPLEICEQSAIGEAGVEVAGDGKMEAPFDLPGQAG